jgi:hypothetical protein
MLLDKRAAKQHFSWLLLAHPTKIASNPREAETSSVAPPYPEDPGQAPVEAICVADLNSS